MEFNNEVLVFAIIIFFLELVKAQKDFYSWLENIKSVNSVDEPGPASCKWESPPEYGYNFSPCSSPPGVCKGIQGSFKRNGTTRVTQCRRHFTLAWGRDVDQCVDGRWTSSGHKCVPCGRSQRSLDPKEVLSLSFKGDLPWQGALYTLLGQEQWEFICGATLLSPNFVITAAHCLTISGTDLKPENVRVAFGKLKSSFLEEPSAVISDIVEIVRPEGYNGARRPFEKDLALLVLARHVTVAADLLPVCVDWKDTMASPKNNETGYLAEWGETKSKSESTSLYRTSVKYIDYNTCRSLGEESVTSDKFCAAEAKGYRADNDDRGGGLTMVRDGIHYLYGVVNSKLFGEERNYRMFTSLQNKENRAWLQQQWRRPRVHSQGVIPKKCRTNSDCTNENVCGDMGFCIDLCDGVCDEGCTCEVKINIPTCTCRNPGTETRQGTSKEDRGQIVATYEQDLGDICKDAHDSLYTCERRSKCFSLLSATSRVSPPLCNYKGETEDDPVICCQNATFVTGRESLKRCRSFAYSVFNADDGDGVNYSLEDTCSIYDENLELGSWSEAKPRELPHTALVTEKTFQRWCMGVLVSDLYVLSNAYCLVVLEPLAVVRLGANQPLAPRPSTGTDHDIQDIAFFPNFDKENPGLYHNLALVRLKSRAKFTPHIRPVCLHPTHVFPESQVTIVGRLNSKAQKGNTTVMTKKECERLTQGDEMLAQGITDESIVCAKALGSLEFNGGMPLLIRLNEPYCMYGLLGMSSYLKELPDNDFNILLYMRVSHYMPWIEKTVWPKTGNFIKIPQSLLAGVLG